MDSMEHMETNEQSKMYELDSQDILDKLHISYNSHTSMIVLWNKFQIFVYENLNFNDCTFAFHPDFKTQGIILSNNYFICLGYDGQVHITSLKFKSPGPKRFKGSFTAHQEGIISWAQYDYDYCFTIKLESNSEWNLAYHKITSDFHVCQKIYLQLDPLEDTLHQLQKKVILKCHRVSEKCYDYFKDLYKVDAIDDNYSLVIMTFDRIVVYCCLFNRVTLQSLGLTELFSCPTELNDIQILETDIVNILVGLTTGSLVRLPLAVGRNERHIMHFNVPILNFLAFGDYLLYTDGTMLWKTSNTYNQEERQLKQLNIKLPRDFIKVGEQIICITFSHQIHVFSVDDESLHMEQGEKIEFQSARKMLSKAKQFEKITKVLNRSDNVCEELYIERDYLISMVLSNRADIIRRMLTYVVQVYEHYEDAIVEHKAVHLTNDVCEYFEPDVVLFLIKVVIAENSTLNGFIKCLLENLKLHITILSQGRILRTASVAIKDIVSDMNILVNLRNKTVTNVKLQIKLIPLIPGALDPNQRLFITMSKKFVKLSSEHFIKITRPPPRTVVFLQTAKNKFEGTVLRLSRGINATLFSFMNITNRTRNTVKDNSYYLRLTDETAARLGDESHYNPNLNKARIAFLIRRLSSDEFLVSRNPVILEIQSERVKVQVQLGDDPKKLIRVSSKNLKLAHDIKDLLFSIMYGSVEDGSDFTDQTQYIVVEDLVRTMHTRLIRAAYDGIVLDLAEEFQDTVISDLPM